MLKRGIQIQERPTSIVSPITAESAIQVVVGAAPVNLAKGKENILSPQIVYRYEEATEKIGMCRDFKQFPLCQSIAASFEIYNVAPLILINILDPIRHKTDATDEVTDLEGEFALISKQGILLDSLVVKSEDRSKIFEKDTDYIAEFQKDGTVGITFKQQTDEVLPQHILVSYDQLDPSKVTVTDVLEGIKKIREVFPRFGVIPGTLIVPGWSHLPEVYHAMIAQADNLNGCFRYTAIVDIDTKTATAYDKCKEIKDLSGINNPHCIAVYPMVQNGSDIFYQSVVLGAHLAYTDYQNGNVPYVSPSNKEYRISGLCNEAGKEIILDMEQASLLNSVGIVTAINFNGWKCWGNRTAVFPSSNDVKDVFIPVRRMFDWWCNTFILTYFSKVDNPINRRLIEIVVNSEQIRANSFKSQYQLAGAGIDFVAEDNPDTDLLSGILKFRMWLTPFPPAESITATIEYDVNALKESLT